MKSFRRDHCCCHCKRTREWQTETKKEGEGGNQAAECLFPEGRCKVKRIPAPLFSLCLSSLEGLRLTTEHPPPAARQKWTPGWKPSGWGTDPLHRPSAGVGSFARCKGRNVLTACQENLGQWPQSYIKKVNRGCFCYFARRGGHRRTRARCGGGHGLGPFALNLEDLQVASEISVSPMPPTGIPLTLWALIKRRKSAELW